MGNAYQGVVGEVDWVLYMDKATVAGETETGGTGGGTEETVQRQPVILGEVLTEIMLLFSGLEFC
jgi:hypothetical protein